MNNLDRFDRLELIAMSRMNEEDLERFTLAMEFLDSDKAQKYLDMTEDEFSAALDEDNDGDTASIYARCCWIHGYWLSRFLRASDLRPGDPVLRGGTLYTGE